MAKKTKTESKVEIKTAEKKTKKKKFMFEFQEFINVLRADESKKDVIERYEKTVLNGGTIEGDVFQQKWYIDYVGKFNTDSIKFRVPEELVDDFDWELLFKLIASSYSSEYGLENPVDNDTNGIPELYIRVKSEDQTIKKNISDLWSFQIYRLFEIYCEEQINMESIRLESSEGEKDIYKEREERFAFFGNVTGKRKLEEGDSLEIQRINNCDDTEIENVSELETK